MKTGKSKYNFELLFEKLEEEKELMQKQDLKFEINEIKEVLDEIEYLKEVFDTEDENGSTLTRA